WRGALRRTRGWVMFLNSWRKWGNRVSTPSAHERRTLGKWKPRRPTCRPEAEELEDRTLLSSGIFIPPAQPPVVHVGLQFSAPTFSILEGAVAASVTVTRTGFTGGTATVSYATGDGSARAGTDYTATSGTLTFTPGAATQTFSVPLLNDGAVEKD